MNNGLIFGVNSAKNFYCMDAKSGELNWTDRTPRGQCGSILNLGSTMLALTSDKDLIAFKSNGKEYTEVAIYRGVSDAETWCVPIVAGNRIYVKDKAGSLTLWTIE